MNANNINAQLNEPWDNRAAALMMMKRSIFDSIVTTDWERLGRAVDALNKMPQPISIAVYERLGVTPLTRYRLFLLRRACKKLLSSGTHGS